MPRETQVLHAASPGAVEEAAGILKRGGLVAFPTETVYGLGADGLNPEAVRRVFAVKGRPADNPLTLHVAGPSMLDGLVAHLSPGALPLMDAFWPGPLTLVVPRGPLVPDVVTAGGETVAVRCPDHPVALALINALGRPIAAPSANLSGRPSPTRPEHVWHDLAGRIEAILDGGPTALGIESTVMDLTVTPPRLLRLGAVTLEELRGVLPEAVNGRRRDTASPPSPLPTAKYRHYTPLATVILVAGELSGVIAEVRRTARRHAAGGRRVAIIATEETAGSYAELEPAVRVAVAGMRAEITSVAKSIYNLLRRLDGEGMEIVVVEGFTGGGLAEVIMDRLQQGAREIIWVK